MKDQLVTIPLSIAKRIGKDAPFVGSDEESWAVLSEAIEKSEREAALSQAAALTQDQYADTVNPLRRPAND